MLEDVLQPQRLFWLVHHETGLADEDGLRAIMDHIEDCVSFHVATGMPYQREVIKVAAALWLRLNNSDSSEGRLDLPDTYYIGRFSPILSQKQLGQVCEELVHGTDPRHDMARLLVYQFVHRRVARVVRVPYVLSDPAGRLAPADILRRILVRYAPECTFKTHGDANVHCELILNHLPAWLSCAMVRHEMPYPLMIKAYPEKLNTVVRPYLDRSVVDSVDDIAWFPAEGAEFCVGDFVVMFCLILEILATRHVMFLVNGAVVKHRERTWPLPFVCRDANMVVEYGVRANESLFVFPACTSAVDVCVEWLRMCQKDGMAECRNLYDLVLDPENVGDRNPLRKYLL